MTSKLNFVGNVIDLASVEVDKLMAWMYPHPSNPTFFKYPSNHFLQFTGIVSDQEMFEPSQKNSGHNNDPAIIVLKDRNTSNLTAGRLNTIIRTFVREYSEGKPGDVSKEMSVLPRNFKSGLFSCCGDSRSVVVYGKGRVCEILISRDGATNVSGCAFITSINFLAKRLADYEIMANIIPLPVDL